MNDGELKEELFAEIGQIETASFAEPDHQLALRLAVEIETSGDRTRGVADVIDNADIFLGWLRRNEPVDG